LHTKEGRLRGPLVAGLGASRFKGGGKAVMGETIIIIVGDSHGKPTDFIPEEDPDPWKVEASLTLGLWRFLDGLKARQAAPWKLDPDAWLSAQVKEAFKLG